MSTEHIAAPNIIRDDGTIRYGLPADEIAVEAHPASDPGPYCANSHSQSPSSSAASIDSGAAYDNEGYYPQPRSNEERYAIDTPYEDEISWTVAQNPGPFFFELGPDDDDAWPLNMSMEQALALFKGSWPLSADDWAISLRPVFRYHVVNSPKWLIPETIVTWYDEDGRQVWMGDAILSALDMKDHGTKMYFLHKVVYDAKSPQNIIEGVFRMTSRHPGNVGYVLTHDGTNRILVAPHMRQLSVMVRPGLIPNPTCWLP
ncbi:hypothetical protein HOO65_010544 [Ceratocystis lukuohia]|uniref:Uncharacterized protein n=2 Tax=Ceratocystis TaxID=5157 RepID=A0A2C5X1K3_9PEZI|nr:hypothetical protein CFIMG_008587RA00001 [Ceratocystis fimbriata CBS 114723]